MIRSLPLTVLTRSISKAIGAISFYSLLILIASHGGKLFFNAPSSPSQDYV